MEFIGKFPALFLESEEKTSALAFFAEYKEAKKRVDSGEDVDGMEKENSETLRARLIPLINELKIDESVRIELRFDELRYTLVEQLQKDPLVDGELTPQSRASIRIVLGTVIGLANG